MLNLTFISQEIKKFPLTLFFNENQELVFISCRNDFLDDAQKNFKNASFQPQISNQQTNFIFHQLEKYFSQEIISFDFNYKLIGTDFQMKVWTELNQLGYGEIISYSEMAQRINQPKAVRAVAHAIGMNPLPIVIPCHRVNGKDTQLHGYRGGLELKQNLQRLEKQKIS